MLFGSGPAYLAVGAVIADEQADIPNVGQKTQ